MSYAKRKLMLNKIIMFIASFNFFECIAFSNINAVLQQKCQKEPSSIWRWDLNSQPLGHESTPVTTRPVRILHTIFHV